ncbi:MAG: aromatic ring-hydroxylating oxygenase subunit alpha, partial [Candidatus Binatia bacterium]
RGNKVVWEGRGTCQAFTCKFHGWTYNTQGQLTFVPDEEGFFDLKKSEHGLTPAATDTWEGFIFIHLDRSPKESLKVYLGELGERLHGYPFAETSATCYSWTTEVRANWKAIKDAFQESYHVAFLHKRSLPDSFTDTRNPFGHGLDVKLYPRHHSMTLCGNPEHQPTAVEALAYKFGSLLIRNDFSTERLPQGVNWTRDPSWAIDLNVIFPNFFLDVQEGTYFTYNMWPLAVDRTLWEIRSYYPQATSAGQRFSQEYGKVLFRDVLTEDANTLEKTQSVLASGAKTHFILQDQELLVRHDQKVHEDFVGFYRERNRDKEKNGKGIGAHA